LKLFSDNKEMKSTIIDGLTVPRPAKLAALLLAIFTVIILPVANGREDPGAPDTPLAVDTDAPDRTNCLQVWTS